MEKLKTILSKVLGIDKAKITDDLSPGNVDTWDSFNGLLLVSELEKCFNVKFTIEDVTSIKCVKDIKASLKKHGVKLEED